MKQGLEFIADRSHTITEENLFRLYQMTIGDFLPAEDRLLPEHWYRHDSVYIVGSKVEHTGLPWQKLPAYMAELVAFAAEKTAQNDLIKAAILHFAFAYLHPYFDGNGRMARLLHLWYLVQQGYSSALLVPMSRFVEESRSRYYKAYTQVEQNQQISGVLDVTPFLVYFAESVYHRLGEDQPRKRCGKGRLPRRSGRSGSLSSRLMAAKSFPPSGWKKTSAMRLMPRSGASFSNLRALVC